MPTPGKDKQLTNKIEQLLSGQITLDEAKEHANSENREILDLAARLSNCQPVADYSYQTNLEKRLLRHYQCPKFGTTALKLGFRRIKIIAAASLASLLLLSGIAMAIPGMRKLIINPPSGNIEVISTPEKAKVFIDNVFKGTTPLLLKEVAAGTHELKVSKENYEDWSGVLRVKQKTTLRVVAELNKIEVMVVKPKRTAKAGKSHTKNMQASILSPSTGDKATLEETVKQNDNTGSSKESEQNLSAPSSDPAASTDSPKEAIELLLPSESLVLAGNNAIYRIGAQGEKENIIESTKGLTDIALSPTGSMIALVDNSTLKVINTHNKDSKFTYKANSSSIKNPRWSPDESSLLFTVLDEDSSKSTIYKAKISSRNVRKLVVGTIDSWSPSGREIAYTKETGGIFITDSEGRKEQQILPRIKVLDLKWSPSGIKIAFITSSDESFTSSPSLFILDKDGTELKKIVVRCTAFSWSPDGDSIVFEKKEKRETNIYLAGLDGKNPISIANDAKSPIFSPDSQRIAFTKDDGIYIANLDGSNVLRILSEPNLVPVGWNAEQ